MPIKFWYWQNNDWHPAYEIIQEVLLPGREKEYRLWKARETESELCSFETVGGILRRDIRKTKNRPINNKCKALDDIIGLDVRELIGRASQSIVNNLGIGPGFLWLKGKWVSCSILRMDDYYVKIQTAEKKWMWVSRNLIFQGRRIPKRPNLEKQPWSLYRVGESVRVYQEPTRDWLRGDVEAVGASGAIWVSVHEEGVSEGNRCVKVRSDSWKVHRDIPGDKMVIWVKVVEANGMAKGKLKLTFDRWTTDFGAIRKMLAEEHKIGRNTFEILLNKEVLENTTKNNDVPAMSILMLHGDGCCLEMIMKDAIVPELQDSSTILGNFERSIDFTTQVIGPGLKSTLSSFEEYQNSSESISNTEVGPGEETFDSEDLND